MKYLLPCQCGHRTEVEPGQAGQRMTCVCGASLDVPTMRELRRLEPVEVTAPPKPRRAPWQGALFVVGMLVLAVGVGVGIYFLRLRAGLDTAKPEATHDHMLEQRAASMTGEQLVDEMRDIETRGLGPRPTPEYVENRRLSARHLSRALLCFAVAGGGLALALLSALIRPRGVSAASH